MHALAGYQLYHKEFNVNGHGFQSNPMEPGLAYVKNAVPASGSAVFWPPTLVVSLLLSLGAHVYT